MLDLLRRLRDRPIEDSERPALFGLAIVAIIAGAVAFGLVGRPAEAPEPAGTVAAEPATSEPPATSAEPAPVEDNPAELPIPTEEETTAEAEQPSRGQIEAAREVASRFLAAYLPYSYGNRAAKDVPLATDELARALREGQPRPYAGQGGGKPRVATLQVNGIEPDAIGLLALVDDGKRTYTVTVGLALTERGWKVTGVGV